MVSKYLAYNEKVSVIYAEIDFMNDIKKMQNLTGFAANILGKFYMVSSLMGFSEIKESSDEIVIELNGGGKTGVLYSIIKLDNNNVIIKGFIENPKIDIDESQNIEDYIGKNGNLIVIKNNRYTRLGYKGITPLISGNIVDDFKSYFENSTQKPAFLDVDFVDNKVCGYLITFMPDCSDEDVQNIKNSIKTFSLTNNIDNINEIAKSISGDPEIKCVESDLEVLYRCDCSKEKYTDMFYTLKKSELESIIKDDDKINVVCQYCNKSYDFSKEEIESIINNL